MKLVLLSDLHGNLPEVPEHDLVIIAGDLCPGPVYIDGKWRPDLSNSNQLDWLYKDFANWAKKNVQTVCIAGNHDTAIEEYGFNYIPKLVYLKDNWCVFNGIRIWGTPWIRRFDNLAFNADSLQREKAASLIHSDTDILICHSPLEGIRDQIRPDSENLGCRYLNIRVNQIKPKLVVCGHIHESAGITLMENRTLVVNAACKMFEIEI